MTPIRLPLLFAAFASMTTVAFAASVGPTGLTARSDPEDPTYPACDNADGSVPLSPLHSTLTAWDTHPQTNDVGHHLFYSDGQTPKSLKSRRGNHDHPRHRDDPSRVSDDPVLYVAPGFGSCEFNYTNEDPGVCLAPGWIRSAHVNGCNKWVEVELPSLGTSTYARVLDACGAVKDSTFGCNDAYLTLSAFSALVQGNVTLIANGRTPGPIKWRFRKEPCSACWKGLPGKLGNGHEDDCQGEDDSGFIREGRKTGKDILTNITEIGLKCTGSAAASTKTSTNLAVGNLNEVSTTNNLFGTPKHFDAAGFKQKLFNAFGTNKADNTGKDVSEGGKQTRSMGDSWKEGKAHLWQA
ncbi:unnamed protein product [Sympodiomycopsis kandeliae]